MEIAVRGRHGASREILRVDQRALFDGPVVAHDVGVLEGEARSDECPSGVDDGRNTNRRAVSARTYLISLGLDANRLKVVSYGSEFPFDPGHDEPAWRKNRRAHFVITAK